MNEFIRLTIFGLVASGVYFIAASGLVVTYTTSGVFNFAHGATGMIAAFVYWELRGPDLHLPAPLALFLVLGVFAPVVGIVIERVLVRNLRGASLATTLVVTVGLLAGLIGLAQTIWKPATRTLPGFFGDTNGFKMLGVFITWHRAITILLAVAVAIGLRLLLYRTRVGIAMRAVVDNRDLAALNGVRPDVVSSLSWALGSALAALAGILLASILALDPVQLTLLVVNAYAAAMVGRLRSLPMTLLGAVILGLLVQYIPSYLPRLFAHNRLPSWIINLNQSIPVLMLFVVLLVLPEARLRGWRPRSGLTVRVSSLRRSLLGGALLVAGAAVFATLVPARGVAGVSQWGTGLALGIVVLSLVPLTGWAGQVSLCQLTLAGVGAFAMAKAGATGAPVGLLAAIALAGAVGALVALPALRLQGLYLALSTLAVAVLADNMFFPQRRVLFSGTIPVGRLRLGPVRFDGDRVYFVLLAVAYAAVAITLLALRRGRFGRRLAAMRDSPAACATLGLDLTRTKLAVFTLSAAIAGLGGALYGGLLVTVGPEFFSTTQGLAILLLAVIGGIATVSGALLASMAFAGISILAAAIHHFRLWPHDLAWLPVIAPGLVGVTLGYQPDGAVPDLVRRWHAQGEWIRRALGRLPARAVAAPGAAGDEVTLAGLGPELALGAPLRRGQLRALDRVLGIEDELGGEEARVEAPAS